MEARRATQAERWAAAERASCDRVDEVAAASRLGKLVVRFDYDLTLLVAGRRIRLTWRQRRGRDVGGVEQALVVAGGRDPRRRGVRRVAVLIILLVDDGNHCRPGQCHLHRGAILLPRRRIHDGVLQ